MAIVKDLPADEKLPRPKNVAEKRSYFRLVYKWNRWNWDDHISNCKMVGLEVKKSDEYSEAELDVFLKDFIRHQMIIFK